MSKPILAATILNLDYKHYGTNIRLVLDDGRNLDINVWISGGAPSDEALKEWEVTREEWEANVEVDNGWEGTSPIQNMFPSDCHYQSQYELEICEQIVKAINGDR